MHALAKLCVHRPVFATMLILALVVTGTFTYFSLGLDRFPNTDMPMVTVSVTDTGASPEEVESEITKKVEDAVNTISQVDTLSSTSSEGLSLVTISFDLSKNGDVAAQEVQSKINQILNNLPSSAKTPVVSKMDMGATAVIELSVSAPRSTRDVTMIADKLLKQRLETVAGVGQVTIKGGATREVHVVVDPERLRAQNLTISAVVAALQTQNSELPGGSLKAGAKDVTVRTTGKLTSVEAFNEVVVSSSGGRLVRIRDIGYAEDSSKEPTSTSRLDGAPAVQLSIAKQSSANTTDVANNVKVRLAEITPSLPKDVKWEIVSDQSVFVKAAIDAIKDHLIEGSLLAALVIFLFLANIRTTIIAAVAIPTSIISTFSMMKVMGYTMNQITMLALTLMVGVVVDDAIIVLENIYRCMEEKGLSPVEAAIQGTREIGLAVMATTFSLLAVFIPVGFMGGMTGRFMSAFGFTCSFAIAVSLLVSFTLTPMLCSRFIKPPKPGEQRHQSKDSAFFRGIDGFYTVLLKWSMGHRKAIIACCVLAVISIVPLFMMVGKNFLPTDDQSEYKIGIRLPEGSSLAETTRYAEEVATKARHTGGVLHTLTTVGRSSTGALNEATIDVKLVDLDHRNWSTDSMVTRVRKELSNHPANIHLSVAPASSMGGGEGQADVQYYLQGPDLNKLSEYSNKLMDKVRTVPGFSDVDTSLRYGSPEVRLAIDRSRAADLGVSVQDIQVALSALVAGQTATTFNAGEDQYDVRVRASDAYRGTVEGLDRLTVASSKLGTVRLSEVTRAVTGTGSSSIHRLGRERVVNITGNLLPGASQSDVVSALDKFIGELDMGPEYRGGSTGMTKELNKTGYYFGLAFALAFIFIYIVLAAQFESFVHPITILITLPLAVPFGILALILGGQNVNLFSGLGLLVLFGVVKKNAILQIDHTNGLRAQGMSRYDAIIQANRDRLRPILMTTMALVFGMIPLLVSRGAGSATNHSIGVLVAGGQTLCLLLTLLAVPVFYSLWEDLGEWLCDTRLGRRFEWGRSPAMTEQIEAPVAAGEIR